MAVSVPTGAVRASAAPHARLRGGIAALTIVTLVAGIPAALLSLLGSPVPAAAPTLEGVLGALTRPDDGQLLLGLLEVVAWVAWGMFTASIAVEVLARASALRIPSLGPQQAAAATLVATAALLLAPASHGPAAAAGPGAGQPAPAGATETASGGAEVSGASTDAATAPPPGFRAHVVEAGEHLWQIAEEELGEGSRHGELFRATRGLAQPDGRVLERPDLIRPGWTVLVPGTGAGGATAADTSSAAHRVQPGDTLWDIAADRLGDPHRYQQIADLNGIGDPARIDVGQVLAIPGVLPGSQTAEPQPGPSAGAAQDDLLVLTPLAGAGPAAAPAKAPPAADPVPPAMDAPPATEAAGAVGAAERPALEVLTPLTSVVAP
jgi:nucleoid-associated protein YgaU